MKKKSEGMFDNSVGPEFSRASIVVQKMHDMDDERHFSCVGQSTSTTPALTF